LIRLGFGRSWERLFPITRNDRVNAYPDDERCQGVVHEHEVRLEVQAGVEAEDVVQVGDEVVEAVHVGHDEQLRQPDEEVRPSRRVVVQQLEEVASALEKYGINMKFI